MAKPVGNSFDLLAVELQKRLSSKQSLAVILRRIARGERLMVKLLRQHFACRIEALEKKIKKLEARA